MWVLMCECEYGCGCKCEFVYKRVCGGGGGVCVYLMFEFVDVGGFACAGEYLWCLNVWVRVRVWA